jgi:hypothetical protein
MFTYREARAKLTATFISRTATTGRWVVHEMCVGGFSCKFREIPAWARSDRSTADHGPQPDFKPTSHS